jgi:hypothetical protein
VGEVLAADSPPQPKAHTVSNAESGITRTFVITVANTADLNVEHFSLPDAR